MRRVLCVILIAACVLAQAALCAQAEKVTPLSCRMEITVLEEAQALYVRQTLTAENRTGHDLSRLMFAVPANCFRRESTLPYDNATLESAFPAGYAPAGIEFSAITVNGEAADWGVEGENEAFLRVACDWKAGQRVAVEFRYTLLISENEAFLGASGHDWRVTQFYPALCVYEAGDYVTVPLSRAGEWVYSEVCDYSVSILAPEGFDLAAGGEVRRAAAEDGLVRYDISLPTARSFAFALSRRFHTLEGVSALGTPVTVYGSSRLALRRALKQALETLDAMERWFGPLPCGRLALAGVSTARPLAATGLVLLDEEELDDGDLIRFHIARQYFQEAVSADPALEPWLFEALSQYAALLAVEETAGEAAYARALDAALRPALQITVPGGYTVTAYAPLFATQREYEIIVRERGAAVLNELKKVMGRENMLRALAEYLRENRFSRVSADSLARALERATGRSWDEALASWLYSIDDYTREALDLYQ